MNAPAPESARPGRVLIVDDDVSVAEGLRLLLDSEDIAAEVHTSLITLPLTIRKFDPDVVLLDLSMPGLSGDAYFKAGAHRFIASDIPVILFSGRPARDLARLTEELGADGFISKEQDALDVVRRVRTWIAHRRALQRAAGRKVSNATRSASSASDQQRKIGGGGRPSQWQLSRQQNR